VKAIQKSSLGRTYRAYGALGDGLFRPLTTATIVELAGLLGLPETYSLLEASVFKIAASLH